jgi:hypothetical protein
MMCLLHIVFPIYKQLVTWPCLICLSVYGSSRMSLCHHHIAYCLSDIEAVSYMAVFDMSVCTRQFASDGTDFSETRYSRAVLNFV